MLLTTLVFLPLVFAAVLLFWPKLSSLRHLAFGFSVLQFLLTLSLIDRFNGATASLQFVEKYPWIERFGISYFLGIDGISLWLIVLTNFLTPIIILARKLPCIAVCKTNSAI